jgi:hypothetical protein
MKSLQAALLLTLGCAFALGPFAAATRGEDNKPPEGFVALFNGKDLTGWKGKTPNWQVVDGVIAYDGKAGDLVTERADFRNFVLHVDWKIEKGADSGIFPRGVAQVQIWDNPEGSGGLWNQGVKALKKADKPLGEWNRFEIAAEGDHLTVKLNGEIVVEKTDKMFAKSKKDRGPIVLQNHGNPLWFKNIYIKELP